MARRLRTVCPACAAPGFGIVRRLPGLRCEWCGSPTHLACAEIHACARCDFQKEFPIPNAPAKADPQFCDYCNP